MLDTVLAGVSTSRIGFGCGRLVGGAAMKQSRLLVETALNLGIRHFDTAPSYGLGSSEDVLGAVLEGEGDVTVVTKVGQARPSAPGLKAFARQALRPLLTRAPALRARLAKATAPGGAPSYSPGATEASLADSLTRLRRSCVTATLLHEIDAQSLTPDVARAMHEQRDLGRTLALGSGTGAGLDGLVPFGTISQYRWQPEVTDCPAGDVILHGALRQFPQPDRFSASQIDGLRALGREPSDPQCWAGVAQTLALATHRAAILLVSTTSPQRLVAGVKAIDWTIVGSPDDSAVATMRAVLSDMPA